MALIITDILRVAPLVISELATGTQQSAGNAMFVGLADILVLMILVWVRPRFWPIASACAGMALGVTVKMFFSTPALSGWLAICLPWLIVNWKQFKLTRNEWLMMAKVAPFYAVWAIVIFTGHLVDPAMQQIGWFYGTKPGIVEIGDPVQIKVGPGQYLVRRVAEINNEEQTASLLADNANFGAIVPGKALVVRLQKLRAVSWTWSPRKWVQSITHKGQFQNLIELHHDQNDIFPSPSNKWVAVQKGPEIFFFLSPLKDMIHAKKGKMVEWQDERALYFYQEEGSAKRYSLFDPNKWEEEVCDEDGDSLLSLVLEGIQVQDGVIVRGQAYYAMDGDTTTTWKTSPITDMNLISTIDLNARRKTITIQGQGDVGVSVAVNNGESVELFLTMTDPVSFPIEGKSVRLELERAVAESEGEITSIVLD